MRLLPIWKGKREGDEMSKIDELIKKYCPDGVEYKRFSDIADYVRGITYGKGDEVNDDSKGGTPVLRANNITLGNNTLNFDDVKYVRSSVKIRDTQYLHADDILICAGSGSKGHIGKVAYIKEDMDCAFGGFMAVIRIREDAGILSRFMFHNLISTRFREHIGLTINSSTINNLNAAVIANFQIPVPPLPVQKEIVRILDKFTELEAELEMELQVELEARKKQYEYYRNKLLSFDNLGNGGGGGAYGAR